MTVHFRPGAPALVTRLAHRTPGFTSDTEHAPWRCSAACRSGLGLSEGWSSAPVGQVGRAMPAWVGDPTAQELCGPFSGPGTVEGVGTSAASASSKKGQSSKHPSFRAFAFADSPSPQEGPGAMHCALQRALHLGTKLNVNVFRANFRGEAQRHHEGLPPDKALAQAASSHAEPPTGCDAETVGQRNALGSHHLRSTQDCWACAQRALSSKPGLVEGTDRTVDRIQLSKQLLHLQTPCRLFCHMDPGCFSMNVSTLPRLLAMPH